jgi:hypothetical protein
MRILVLVTIAVFFATAAFAAPFTNGSFENPAQAADGQYNSTLATGWTTYTNNTVNNNALIMRYTPPSTVPVPDGAQYQQMQIVTNANKYGGFLQTFDTVANQNYYIRGSFRPLSGAVTCSVGVQQGTNTNRPTTWGAVAPGTNTAWQTFGFNVTATGSTMTIFLDVYSTAAGKSGAFDNIVIPEPGSMVAIFSGLVGLVGVGIRRRK